MSAKLVKGQQVKIDASDMAGSLLASLGWRRDGVYTGTLVWKNKERCCVEVDGDRKWFDVDLVTPC